MSYIDITMSSIDLAAVAITLGGRLVTHKAGEPESGCPSVTAMNTKSIIGSHNGLLDDEIFAMLEAREA